MLSKLIEVSLRHRVAVLLITGLLVLAGLLSVRELPFDAYPDTTPVQAEAELRGGAGPCRCRCLWQLAS